MAYSYAQLKDIWTRNGGDPKAADIAAAIALAESGGDPGATGHNTNGSVDRGLWQINSIHGSQSVYDVDANAKSAISISGNGTNWKPWTTWGSGAWKQFYKGGSVTFGNSEVGPQPAPLDPFSAAINALNSSLAPIAEFVTNAVKAGSWFADIHNIIRIAQVIGGAILTYGGIIVLAGGLVEEKIVPVVESVAGVAAKV